MSGLVQRIRGSVRRRIRTLFKKQPRPAKPKPTPAYRQALDEIDVAITDIVIIVPRGGVRLAEDLATDCPSATVHLLAAHPVSAKRRAELPDNVVYAYCPDQQARLRRLARMPQPQLIIERGLEVSGERVDTFRELFGMVAKGGRYVVDSTPAQDAPAEAHDEAGRMGMHLAELAESAKITSGEHTYDIELGRSLGPVRTVSGRWIIAKRLSHQWKLRDSRANELLQARFASAWGEVITSKPAVVHISRAKGVAHGDGLRSLPPDFSVPQRFLRRYVGVNCYVRKRAQLGDYWLPDTFRNPRKRGLDHLGLHSTGPVMARAAGEPDPPIRTLDGPFFYLDSEYFSHFGHVLTDVVGNTWGWQLVKQRVPGLRPLLSMPSDHATVPAFQRQIFAALGIDPDSIEYVRPGGVQVAELYSCTSDWAMPRYCAPELVDVWQRIRAACMTRGLQTPELIFISRRPREIRTCLNTAAVESFFAGLGFAVVYPEDLDFGEQVATFAQARVVAGFGGSGMISSMFARPDATVLVLSGDSYTAINEYLIKSLIGGDIHYFWSRAELRHPGERWTWEAFRSNFVFDLERFGPEIVDVVSES